MPRLTPDSIESENGSSPSEAYSGDSFCRQGDCSHLVSGIEQGPEPPLCGIDYQD